MDADNRSRTREWQNLSNALLKAGLSGVFALWSDCWLCRFWEPGKARRMEMPSSLTRRRRGLLIQPLLRELQLHRLLHAGTRESLALNHTLCLGGAESLR
jgi:hypothetical protein